MNKQEFLTNLEEGLSGLPKSDIEERLNFYGEMIDDRIEEGVLEEDAVLEMGDIDTVVKEIIADTPLTKLVKEKVKPKHKLSVWEIILLVLGSPIWLSVLLAVLAVIFSIYVSVWSVIICLWAVFVSLLGISLGGLIWGVTSLFIGNALVGVAVIGLAVFSIGLSVFMFFGSKLATKGVILLTKMIVLKLKNSFIKKEAK